MSLYLRRIAPRLVRNRATFTTYASNLHPKAQRPKPSAYKPPPKPASTQPNTPPPPPSPEPTTNESPKVNYLWPFGSTAQKPTSPSIPPSIDPSKPEDPEKLHQARVQDPHYKAAARRWIVIMCGTPVLIFLSGMLYQRLVLGIEQKKPLVRGKAREEGEGVGVD